MFVSIHAVPTGVRVVSKGSNFITYAWNDLPYNVEKGQIKYYLVSYSWKGAVEGIDNSRSFKTKSSTYKATPLKPNTKVSFQVAAFYNAGTDGFSPPLIVTTAPAPVG